MISSCRGSSVIRACKQTADDTDVTGKIDKRADALLWVERVVHLPTANGVAVLIFINSSNAASSTVTRAPFLTRFVYDTNSEQKWITLNIELTLFVFDKTVQESVFVVDGQTEGSS